MEVPQQNLQTFGSEYTLYSDYWSHVLKFTSQRTVSQNSYRGLKTLRNIKMTINQTLLIQDLIGMLSMLDQAFVIKSNHMIEQ